jgi:hypothetical protein
LKKTILLTILLFTVLFASAFLVEAGTVDLSSPSNGFGFQNGNYLYFRDPVSVNVVLVIAFATLMYRGAP